MNAPLELQTDVQHKFHRFATDLPVAQLLQQVKERPELWDEITERQTVAGSPHTDTKSILLRWCKDLTVEAAMNDLEAVDYPAAEKLWQGAWPVFENVLRYIGDVSIGRVMIVSLKPGGRIPIHINEGSYADRYDRLHVPLQSDEGNRFSVDGDDVYMHPGELWWFNHKRPHWVENYSERERIHLIIDVESPALRDMRGIYYQRERCWDLWDEITPLNELHRAEITSFPDVPLKPMYDLYESIERNDALRCYTVRMNGKLIGYSWYFIHPHIHYSIPIAMCDIVFVHKDHRQSHIGNDLIDYCDERLVKEDKRNLIIYHVKAAHPALGKILQRRGYELGDLLWQKRF
jgi:predicted acetyltransferase